jgi:hypothetical protein
MRTHIVIVLAAFVTLASGQPSPTSSHKVDRTQPAAGRSQQQADGRSKAQKEDFFTSSTKLVNKTDIDYGAMLERRRQAFLDASAANPFFWYSALTTALLMVLMFAYGVRVMDEKRKLWRAAEILNDVWNDAQYARVTAETAIERHNRHMEACNRVIEAQLSGRPSPAALETTDARNELTRVRGELDSVDSERKLLKAKLDEKEKLVDDLSVRLSALEKGEQSGCTIAARTQNGGSGHGESEGRLIARINQLTQQLEAEKQKNRALKGA